VLWSGAGDAGFRLGEGLVLVLTRKAKEGIMIGDDIEIKVLANDGTKVRIGVSAPSNVPVHRTEIWLEIKSQGDGAAPRQPARAARARRAH
jgi:carbon storage regulator